MGGGGGEGGVGVVRRRFWFQLSFVAGITIPRRHSCAKRESRLRVDGFLRMIQAPVAMNWQWNSFYEVLKNLTPSRRYSTGALRMMSLVRLPRRAFHSHTT